MTITPAEDLSGFVFDNTVVDLLVSSSDSSPNDWQYEADNDVPTAVREVSATAEHLVQCRIKERGEVLIFEVEAMLSTNGISFNADRSIEVDLILKQEIDDGPYLQRYEFGGCEDKAARFFFMYPWLMPEALQKHIPDGELIGFCNEYVNRICAPYPSILPLIALYLRGTMPSKEELRNQICATLDFLTQKTQGNA